MKQVLLALALFVPPITGYASEENLDVVRTQLCQSWKYDFNSSSYTCSFTGPYVSLVEANRVESRIKELEDRISFLEKQLDNLKK